MRKVPELGPLFQWADAREIRHPESPLIRQIAKRGRITHLHALAFCQANGICGGAR